jgi:hypothetical protein
LADRDSLNLVGRPTRAGKDLKKRVQNGESEHEVKQAEIGSDAMVRPD